MSCQGLISLSKTQKETIEEFCNGTLTYEYEKGNFCEASWKNSQGESLVHVPEGQKASALLPTGATLSVNTRKGCEIEIKDLSATLKKDILETGQHLEKVIQSKEKKASRKYLKEFKAKLVKLQKKLDKEEKEDLGDQVEKMLDQLDKSSEELKPLHGVLHYLYKSC